MHLCVRVLILGVATWLKQVGVMRIELRLTRPGSGTLSDKDCTGDAGKGSGRLTWLRTLGVFAAWKMELTFQPLMWTT
jgi:hypothetical protein